MRISSAQWFKLSSIRLEHVVDWIGWNAVQHFRHYAGRSIVHFVLHFSRVCAVHSFVASPFIRNATDMFSFFFCCCCINWYFDERMLHLIENKKRTETMAKIIQTIGKYHAYECARKYARLPCMFVCMNMLWCSLSEMYAAGMNSGSGSHGQCADWIYWILSWENQINIIMQNNWEI